MKSLIAVLSFILYTGTQLAKAQNCIPGPNALICGTYGDANGTPSWDWQNVDVTSPSYCSLWYGRTNANVIVSMGSPFVNSNTITLDDISQKADYTREKGWELLKREFGCFTEAAFPHFILYNRYSGMMRIFIYTPAGQTTSYSAMAVEVNPNTSNNYPAVTAFSDTVQTAPDKYLATSTNKSFGKGMVAVGEYGGIGKWSVVQFNPSFDPNIQANAYTGAVLQFNIQGVTNHNMFASIKGGSMASQKPTNFSYKPTQAPLPNANGGFDFKGVGERFATFSTGIKDLRTSINAGASTAITNIGVPTDSALAKVKRFFETIQSYTADDGKFQKTFGQLLQAVKGIGSFFSVAGAVIGLFNGSSGTPAPAPAYVNYDLVLQGTINTKVLISTFLLRVPGTVQNDNNNAPYYNCPLGIFNLKVTPQVDSVSYDRLDREGIIGPDYRRYTSYRMRDNPSVTFNSGAGLELVSTQAALVGEVLPKADGAASYDLFAAHGSSLNQFPEWYIDLKNHMRADFEAGRIEIKHFNPAKFHIFQTPYRDIGCISGLSLTVLATTRVYLQVKAVLKKQNDPASTPIIYIQNYKLDMVPATLTDNEKNALISNYTTLPPFANYTQPPVYISDRVIASPQFHMSPAGTIMADNTISTSGVLNVSSTSTVYLAGGSVTLKPGFMAAAGTSFTATLNNYGYSFSCTAPTVEAYVFPNNCYNTTAVQLRQQTNQQLIDSIAANANEGNIRLYPIPARTTIVIQGIKSGDRPDITIIDQSGRVVKRVQHHSRPTLDVSDLSNGVYFITIQTPVTTTVKKVIIQR